MGFGAVARLLLALHLIQGLLVLGASVNYTKKDQPILVHPPNLNKFGNAEDILNNTNGLAKLHLPLKSTGSCQVSIGGYNFYTVSDDELKAEPKAVAPMPPQHRRLQEAPPTQYDWPAMGAVQVWTTKELVEALLVGNPTIIVAADLDVSEAVPLPVIIFAVTIMGVCSNGQYCKLDAKGMNNIFFIAPGGYLTLKDLDIRNGHCTEGGAIQVSGIGSTFYKEAGALVALNVDFYNNSASAMGGAIYMTSGSAGYYEGCIFYLNSAPLGGAIYIEGAEPLSVSLAEATMSTKNSAAADYRKVDRVTTLDDALPGCGLSSCTSVADSLFLLNWANEGGAVYVGDATEDCVTDATFGASIDIMNVHFENNTAMKGGGMYMQYKGSGSYAQLQDTTFSGNIADYGGDVLLASEGSNINGSYLWAYRTEFEKNNAMFVEYPQTAFFSDCTFDEYKTLNCTAYCYTCSSEGKMHTSTHILGPHYPFVVGRFRERVPWTGFQEEDCALNVGWNVCGFIPDECMPPPSPPPPPTI